MIISRLRCLNLPVFLERNFEALQRDNRPNDALPIARGESVVSLV